MIRIDSIVIVEGKYDKITLENVIDATIITTNGYGIFKDGKKRALIRLLCEKKGAVIITDSDNAGMQIRAYLKGICNTDKITNVYLPQIIGKEKRKVRPSKQGYLGVEGMDEATIISALNKSGVTSGVRDKTPKISKADLYAFGLSGGIASKSARDSLSEFVGLPSGLSSNAFLDGLNAILTREKFIEEATAWRQAQVKN